MLATHQLAQRQEHAFGVGSAQCLEQRDLPGPRILDATALQMILFSNHSTSAGACTQKGHFVAVEAHQGYQTAYTGVVTLDGMIQPNTHRWN